MQVKRRPLAITRLVRGTLQRHGQETERAPVKLTVEEAARPEGGGHHPLPGHRPAGAGHHGDRERSGLPASRPTAQARSSWNRPEVLCTPEAVDGRTFLYGRDRVLESPLRLYELEGALAGTEFGVRASEISS